MKKIFLNQFLVFACSVIFFSQTSRASVIEEFPQLKQHVFQEPNSHIYFGFGVAPFQLIRNTPGVSVDLFQIHYIQHLIDWELMSISFGTTLTSGTTSNVKEYVFKTTPKFRLSPMFSLGPLVGYEFINFPDVKAKLQQGDLFTKSDTFSTQGFIYGAEVAQTFKYKDRYLFRASEIVYKQNYSNTKTTNGWSYFFDDNAINLDHSLIKAGLVFRIQLSFLY